MKNGGWLDAYDEEMQLGGNVYPVNYVPQAENGIEGTMGGLTDQGFNYNGAWGGPSMQFGGDVPKAQNGLWNTNKTQWVDSIHNARRGDLNFVQRYFDPNAGSIPTPRDVEGWKPGQTSTHLMRFDPGSRRVYPSVVNVNGKLKYLPGDDESWNYADDTKEFIEFPTAQQAEWYANNGYKKGTNVLKEKTPKKQMGGNIPGSVGFSYARTGEIPDNGPYAKKTLASAQNGHEMSFYQNGLDWTPRNISRDGSEIPQAEDGKEVKLEDLLKVVNKRAASDNTNSGIQAKVKNQIGAQKSSNQKAEQKVQTLINKAGYSEPHARRAVRTKTDTQANKALENIETDVYRTQMHPDFDPNIPVDQQTQLLNDNSLRARILRGANMLTNTGNPLTDFAAGMVTAPGRSFANLTMDPGNRYFSPNNTGLGNFANFAEDVVNVVPSIIPKAAGALGQVPNALSNLKNLKQEFIYNAIDPVGYGAKSKLLNAPKTFLNNTIINPKERAFRIGDNFNPSLKGRLADIDKTDPFYISTMEQINKLGKNRLDAWRTGLGLEQQYNTFTKTPEGFFRINSMSPEPKDFAALHNDIVAHKYNSGPNGLYTGEDPLIELQRRYQNIASPTIQTKYGEFNINDFLGTRKGNLKPWIQRRKVNQGSRNSNDASIFDTDSQQGVMGGYRWDVKKLPDGDLHFQSNDTWDLHPWQERGNPNLVQDELSKKLNNLHTKNKLKNIEGLKLLGGKPYNIQNNFIIDPKTYKIKSSYEDGGIVKDDNGYWNPENWGKPVEIGSNDITMQGVHEPLLGISDTGDVQMMYPGEDYKFKGKKVTEYPVKKNGGWLEKYN